MNAGRLRFLATRLALALSSGMYSTVKHGPLVGLRCFPFQGDLNAIPAAGSSVSTTLLDHFVPQFNASSCSVASTAIVLNSARSLMGIGGNDHPITQQQILEGVAAVHWKERVSENGYQGRRGLPLDLLGEAVEGAFRHFHVPYREIRTVSLTQPVRHARFRKQELVYRLRQFATRGDCFIIAHFSQGVFVKGLHLPHISPVGAFDAKRNRLLILDVDPDQVSPYWVSFQTFFEGLSWGYWGLLRQYGYSGGGYVWIRMERPLRGS
ncbi:MAG: phytochelatin synthase family protein [Thermodesulfobacteriota bacterium]